MHDVDHMQYCKVWTQIAERIAHSTPGAGNPGTMPSLHYQKTVKTLPATADPLVSCQALTLAGDVYVYMCSCANSALQHRA
jgi:hypothetical protein